MLLVPSATERLFQVANAIEQLRLSGPIGKRVELSTVSPYYGYLNQNTLTNIVEKFAKDEGIITIIASPNQKYVERQSNQSVVHKLGFEYWVLPTEKFSNYYQIITEQYQNETQSHFQIKPMASLSPSLIGGNRKSIEKSETDEKALWITYSEQSREITLNDLFILAKPDFDSENEKVFSYLFKNPKKQISVDTLEQEATGEALKKTLHEIVRDLGFQGDMKKAFFNVSKASLCFRPTLTKAQLEELGIQKIRIKT